MRKPKLKPLPSNGALLQDLVAGRLYQDVPRSAWPFDYALRTLKGEELQEWLEQHSAEKIAKARKMFGDAWVDNELEMVKKSSMMNAITSESGKRMVADVLTVSNLARKAKLFVIDSVSDLNNVGQ